MDDAVIRPYHAGDEAAINDAFNAVFGADRALAEWAWKFQGEPEGRWIMVAVAPHGEVLAQYAAVPARFKVDDRVVRAGQLVDVFTRREARRGLATGRLFLETVRRFFVDFGAPDRLAVQYGFPGERHLRLGVGHLGYGEMPLQPVGYWVRPARRRGSAFTGHRVRSGLDRAAADDLWRRAAPRYRVGVVRDAAWLLRRFTGRPGVEYQHLSAWRRGRVHAWAVVRVRETAVAWAELVWDGEDPGALAALDRAIAGRARAAGVGEVELWLMGDGEAETALARLGWTRGEQPQGLNVGGRSFHPDIAMAAFPGRLYVTMGDADLV